MSRSARPAVSRPAGPAANELASTMRRGAPLRLGFRGSVIALGALVAIAVALGIGLNRGSAASLGSVTAISLGAATATVVACQSSPVTVTFGSVGYDATVGAYVVQSLVIDGLTDGCENLTLRWTIFGGPDPGRDVALASGSRLLARSIFGTLPSTRSFTIAVPAELVRGVALVIG